MNAVNEFSVNEPELPASVPGRNAAFVIQELRKWKDIMRALDPDAAVVIDNDPDFPMDGAREGHRFR